jgi:hypothetical protein
MTVGGLFLQFLGMDIFAQAPCLLALPECRKNGLVKDDETVTFRQQGRTA